MNKFNFRKVNKLWITGGLIMLMIVSTFFLLKPAKAEPTYARLPSGNVVHNPVTIISYLSQSDFLSNPLGCTGSIDYWVFRFEGENSDFLGQYHWGVVNSTLNWQITETFNLIPQHYNDVKLQVYDEFDEMCANFSMNDSFTVTQSPTFGVTCGFGGGDCEFTDTTKDYFNFIEQNQIVLTSVNVFF